MREWKHVQPYTGKTVETAIMNREKEGWMLFSYNPVFLPNSTAIQASAGSGTTVHWLLFYKDQ
jgi:hypothetical protein